MIAITQAYNQHNNCFCQQITGWCKNLFFSSHNYCTFSVPSRTSLLILLASLGHDNLVSLSLVTSHFFLFTASHFLAVFRHLITSSTSWYVTGFRVFDVPNTLRVLSHYSHLAFIKLTIAGWLVSLCISHLDLQSTSALPDQQIAQRFSYKFCSQIHKVDVMPFEFSFQ